MRVLVGVDGSSNACDALRWAHRFLAPTSPELVVAHAWERPAWETFVGDAARVDEELTADRVRAALRAQVRGALAEEAGAATLLAPFGRPPIELMRAAEEQACDLVVVGQHGADQLAPGWFIGSTSHQLIARSVVPVVVVGEGALTAPDGPPLILAGWDATPHADRAIEWAASMAASLGGTLVVVRADPDATLDAEKVEAEVTATLGDERSDAVDLEVRCVAGPPDEAIAEATFDLEAALVVLGGRPLSPMQVRTVGDVVASVVAHPTPPLVLVP